MEIILFIITLLLIHEMDAIRAKEWKMFIILKNMVDETAYKVFTLIHIPLYYAIIFIMVNGGILEKTILNYVVDIFLIGHSIIHYCFRNNPNNGFTSKYSKIIIYLLGILAMVHIYILLFVD